MIVKPFTRVIAVCMAIAWLSPLYALNFEVGEAEIAWNSKLTAGAGWRTSPRDVGKIGKLNVPGQEYLCSNRGGDTSLGPNDDDCISLFGDPGPNQRLVDARGGYFASLGDDGNLNYDNGDLISALIKINTQMTTTWRDFTLKLNYVGFYDEVNYNFRVTHTNTQYQPAREERSQSVKKRAGLKGEFREAFLLYNFELGERFMSVSVGNQRVRWGEANLHLFNTMDAINPLDAILALQPGFELAELAVPTGMVMFTSDVVENVTAEVIWQYDWDATRVQPSGTFFSSADPAGISAYRPILSLGQFPEDPNDQFIPAEPFRTLSSSTRNSPLSENARAPKDTGQFGIRVNWYAEDFNDGTEFSFYFLNYHSRVPYFSIIEAQATCLRNGAGDPLTSLAACAPFNPYAGGNANPDGDPLPINSSTLLLDYPEDIRMFGVSFNSTLFGWSIAGEYAYRPNLPAQVLISDVFYAGFQQAFAERDISLGPQSLGVLGISLPIGTAGAVLPGAETFLPSFLTQYRGRTLANNNEYQPGEYVQGYEDLKVGQFILNGLKLFPSTLGSDDVTLLVEVGFTHIIDMPREGDLYLQGTYEHTHPSPGADCSGQPAGTNCNDPAVVARINPTQQTEGFAEDFAAGIRFLLQFKYSNLFNSGVTVKPTLVWFEDVYGTTIFPVQNYVEGNRWVIPGFQFDIGQSFNGTLLYQYYDGKDQVLQDRDNVSLSLTYNF